MTQVLLTGGAGYIGSHTAIALMDAGYDVVVLDNFSNSSPEALRRVEQITGKTVTLCQGDIRSATDLATLFNNHAIDAVIHFAGLKAVGESTTQPVRYYDNNVLGTIELLKAMQTAGVKQLVFSSSATVYGDAKIVPITEDAPRSATNPYGQSKLINEYILQDTAAADPSWAIAILRYFNPVGAHPSGLIGEDPNGIPNNLMPFISQVAVGKRAVLSVFGNDYATLDGTGVRDYIHVTDLAMGHLKALQYIAGQPGAHAVNLGTGQGYSVLQMVDAFSRVNQVPVPYQIAPRRPGDIASCYAQPDKAKQLLGWQATHTLEDMVRDTWRWQQNNPDGYATRHDK